MAVVQMQIANDSSGSVKVYGITGNSVLYCNVWFAQSQLEGQL